MQLHFGVRNGRTVAEVRDDGLAGCLRIPRGGSARQIKKKLGMAMFLYDCSRRLNVLV